MRGNIQLGEDKIFVVEFEEPGKDFLFKKGKKRKVRNSKHNLNEESGNTEIIAKAENSDNESNSMTEIINNQ